MSKINLEKDNWLSKFQNKKGQASLSEVYEVLKNRYKENWFTREGLAKIMEDEEFINNLGKMVILENIISYHLALLILDKTKKEFSVILKYLDEKSLGSIVADYRNLSQYNKNLHIRFKNFSDSRTNLTHKLHIGYLDSKTAKKECATLVRKGIKLKNILVTKTLKRDERNQKKFLKQEIAKIKNNKNKHILDTKTLQLGLEAEKFGLFRKLWRAEKKYKIKKQ